jgi:gluconolactonase
VSVRILATGLEFPEGPVWLEDGSVLVAEIRGRRIRRVAPDGTVSVFAETGGGPNGLARGPDGAIYACNNGGGEYRGKRFTALGPAKDYAGGSIQRIDTCTHEVTTLYTHCGEHRLSSPNDLVFDTAGGFYFTDHGKRFPRYRVTGSLYYARADGTLITELVHPLDAPNGVGLSPDGRVLYVAETETARLWAFDVAGPGELKRAADSHNGGRLVCEIPGYQRFDSLALQADGDICIGTLNSGFITVVKPTGEWRQVKMPESYPTNVCFGGPELRTLYVTLAEKGELGAIDWPVPGLPLNY